MDDHIAGSEVTVPNGRGKQRKDNDGATSHKGNTGQQHRIGQHNNNKDEDMTMVEEAKNNNNVEHATKKRQRNPGTSPTLKAISHYHDKWYSKLARSVGVDLAVVRRANGHVNHLDLYAKKAMARSTTTTLSNPQR